MREHQRKAHGMTPSELEEVLDALVNVAEAVHIRFLWRPILSDPNDDMVLETAVNGGADLLVTFNQQDFAAAARGFSHKTVLPAEALRQLREHMKK